MRVSPFEVDAALRLHPDVTEAVAFPAPDARFGETVAAAVVLRDGASVQARDLKWFAFTHLASHKIPQRILFVDAIPRLARRKLASVFGLGSAPAVETRAIQTGVGNPLFILGDAHVESSRPVHVIREPGELRPPQTIEHLAAECIHAMRRVQREGPYALAAAENRREVAIEIARQMAQVGESLEIIPANDSAALSFRD